MNALNLLFVVIDSVTRRRRVFTLLLAALVVLTWSSDGITRANAASSVVTFTSPNPQTCERFGLSVALSSKYVVIGAPAGYGGNGSITPDPGHVYIFDPTGSLLATLSSPNPQAGGEFGWSVATNDTTVVVGAPNENANALGGAGHTYVFSPTGSLIETLTSPNPIASGAFGYSVAMSHSTVVVAAPDENPGGYGDS